tara:strand:- start:143 stop:514 length:372 start_codon:yes stop_codon:yes gene_type:complete
MVRVIDDDEDFLQDTSPREYVEESYNLENMPMIAPEKDEYDMSDDFLTPDGEIEYTDEDDVLEQAEKALKKQAKAKRKAKRDASKEAKRRCIMNIRNHYEAKIDVLMARIEQLEKEKNFIDLT